MSPSRPGAVRQHQVNDSPRFAALLRADGGDTVAGIAALVCPHCLPAPPARRGGLPCRLHLLGGAVPPSNLSDRLAGLAEGLRAVAESMTWHGAPVSAADRASWVEVLGWFGTWDVPVRLLSHGPWSTDRATDR